MPKQSALQRAARAAAEFGDAAEVLRHAAAAVLGLNQTDYRILSSLNHGAAVSAGALAAAVGLSPAATTEAVQRLSARGMLQRRTDPDDRRRAVITLAPDTAAQLDALFAPVRRTGLELLREYSDAELDIVVDFLDRGRRLQLAEAARIRQTLADRAVRAGRIRLPAGS